MVWMGERGSDGVVVVSVDLDGRPVLHLEAPGETMRSVVGRRRVVDGDDSEVVEPDGAGEGDGLVVGALVEFGVTDQDVHVRAAAAGGAGERDGR